MRNDRLWVHVGRIALVGPGLPDWDAAKAVLREDRPYEFEPMTRPVAEQIPMRDRRRHTYVIALAVSTAMRAAAPDGDVAAIPSVFACSGGDTDVIDRICMALTEPDHPVSPQQFINSVHNAPAGYYSIATGNTAATTSLSAYDATFAAGLIEAAAQIRAGQDRILLVAYDVPPPEPIWPFRPLVDPFALAVLLIRTGEAGSSRLGLSLVRDRAPTPLDAKALERLRTGNPAARALPLLQALAQGVPREIVLPYLTPHSLLVEVETC